MNLVTIVGARPQFIKVAAISRAISAQNVRKEGSIEDVLVHTGQHYDANMSDVFFRSSAYPNPVIGWA